MTPLEGVSFVVPVHNGDRWLDAVISAILAQEDGRPFEVLVVEDGSTDASGTVLAPYEASGRIRVVEGPRRGAAAAINAGIRQAAHPIIAQVDQDVILQPGWLVHLTDALTTPGVGAAQGYYLSPPGGSIWARVMGLDLEQRYGRMRGPHSDHVCTGNTVYRAEALSRVGLFDESLGYGYDNDMSYRLAAAGYRLVFRRDARSVHRWREGLGEYLTQQYGLGYGRLDVVAKHRRRVRGDDVSGPGMILHAPAMLAVCASAALSLALSVTGGSWRRSAAAGVLLLAALTGERFIAGMQAAVRFRDPAALAFVPAHTLRDIAWAWALVRWMSDRARGLHPRPSASMRRERVVAP